MLESADTKFKSERPSPLSQACSAPLLSSSSADFPGEDCESEWKRLSLTYPALEIGEDGLAKIVQKKMPPDPLVTKLKMKSRGGPQVMTPPSEPKMNSSQPKEQRCRKDDASKTPAKSPAAARGSVLDHQATERCPIPSPLNQSLHSALLDPFPPTADNQFFILDSSKSYPAGLATYTIIPHHPNNLSVHPQTGERLFYLTPSATIVRASESRLLPVAYRFGDRVKQKDTTMEATVLRRFVLNGKRKYDLKDDMGLVWREIGEDEVESLMLGDTCGVTNTN